VLDCLLLHFLVTLSEALNAAYGIVNQVINQVLIGDLFFVHNLASETHDDLAVINEAGLHYFRELRYQGLLFE
jgi:predicted nicotinamide N-methyase